MFNANAKKALCLFSVYFHAASPQGNTLKPSLEYRGSFVVEHNETKLKKAIPLEIPWLFAIFNGNKRCE
ncbi:hypothetical protein KUL150_29530 [Alteromonas sp. KUL150]|nr:hypothetical protein KUL150_29530 [Alteromonas sp. KUL150]